MITTEYKAKRPCASRRCPELIDAPGRYCDAHAAEAESYRMDSALLSPCWLAELHVLDPVLPRWLVEVARSNPLALPEEVQAVRRDPRHAARTYRAARSIATRHERWLAGPVRCDACRRSVPEVVETHMGGPELFARICENCIAMADDVTYRANPWWCPRCLTRPTNVTCVCGDNPNPPELRWGLRLARQSPDPENTGDPVSAAAGVLLTMAEREKAPAGIRANGSPVPVAFTLDDLSGARLAFVVAQLARRHVREGALGPGWRRRADGIDVQWKDANEALADDPAAQVLARLHASTELARVLRQATEAQRRAIGRKAAGETLTTADRNALHHLRKRVAPPL